MPDEFSGLPPALAASLSRRRFLGTLGSAAGALLSVDLLAACGSAAPAASSSAAASSGVATHHLKVASSEVIWTDLGGAIRKARQAAYFDLFTKEYGIPVTFAEGFSQAKFLAGTKAGTPPTDSFDATARLVISMTEQGLAQKLPSSVNRTNAVTPAKYRDYCGGGYAYSLGMTYKESAFGGSQPKHWKDFFDLSKYPGKRALPKYSGSEQYAVEVALLADGVPKDKLFPLDIDRALNKLRSIKDSTLFFDSFGQANQFVTQGAASIVMNTNARVHDLNAEGAKLTYVYDEALLFSWSGFPVPVHAPHADAMFALIDLMDRPDRQAVFAKQLPYGPTNPDAFSDIDEATKKILPNSPENLPKAVLDNPVAAAKQADELSRKFMAFLAGA
ncbi:MAG: ABC transporter substrate-binding protein [Candidatus Dormibacteria bacterium]